MSALAPRSLQIAWGYWYAKRVLRVTMQEKTLKTTSETISGPYFDMAADTFRKALSTIEVNPEFPADLQTYMQKQAEILINEKKVSAPPDWSKALRPEFMQRAKAGT